MDYNNYRTPMDVLKKYKVNRFEWKDAYYNRTDLFLKLWPEMEEIIYGLERQMISVSFQSKAIKDLLEYWFPDLYCKVSLKDETKKDRQAKLASLNNSSGIKL